MEDNKHYFSLDIEVVERDGTQLDQVRSTGTIETSASKTTASKAKPTPSKKIPHIAKRPLNANTSTASTSQDPREEEQASGTGSNHHEDKTNWQHKDVLMLFVCYEKFESRFRNKREKALAIWNDVIFVHLHNALRVY